MRNLGHTTAHASVPPHFSIAVIILVCKQVVHCLDTLHASSCAKVYFHAACALKDDLKIRWKLNQASMNCENAYCDHSTTPLSHCPLCRVLVCSYARIPYAVFIVTCPMYASCSRSRVKSHYSFQVSSPPQFLLSLSSARTTFRHRRER